MQDDTEMSRHRDHWRGYAYGKRERPGDFLNDRPSEVPTEIDRLRRGYDFIGVEAEPCPGCVYEKGKFIRLCKLHEEIERLQKVYDLAASVVAELTNQETPEDKDRLCTEIDRLREAGSKICEAFELGVFVRDPSGDGDPRWAIKLLPYLRALAAFAKDDEARAALPTPSPTEADDG